MSKLKDLMEALEPPQRAAIEMVRLSLDCFNSPEGTGLFTGVARYSVLASRVEICAVQADSLPRFWALLLAKMRWTIPPKSMDARIVEVLSAPQPHAVLRVLATETASIVTLARMLHDADKSARRAERVPIGEDPFAGTPASIL